MVQPSALLTIYSGGLLPSHSSPPPPYSSPLHLVSVASISSVDNMSTYPQEPSPVHPKGVEDYGEKGLPYDDTAGSAVIGEEYDAQAATGHQLHRTLKGRHMQMIAIGKLYR